MDDILFLEDTNLCIVANFIDTTCSSCDDFESCTGDASTIGFGVLASAHANQKLTTKRSTESELAGLVDYLPKVSCLR